MTVRERKHMFNRIREKYSKEMWIHEGDCGKDERAYSYVLSREIVMPPGSLDAPTEWNILSLLHEIGHVKTNTRNMRVYEKEYYATQWAADEARRIGLPVKQIWKDAYRDYILQKRQMCINKKGRDVASVESLMINW